MDWVNLAQYRDHWRVTLNVGNFLSNGETGDLSRRPMGVR
jgi:hypothetical protein